MPRPQPYSSNRDGGIRIEEIIAGFAQWIESLLGVGWSGFMMTFLFKPLRSTLPRIDRMNWEVGLFYSTFVTRCCRKPRALSSDGRRPILLTHPDLPVFKRYRQSVPSPDEALVNGGLHIGGVLLMPPRSRLRVAADEHFRNEQALYVRGDTGLRCVRADPIVKDHVRVVDYFLKGAKHRTIDYGDHCLVFPRARSELTRNKAASG